MENIRPINSDAEYDRAVAEIARYFDHEPVAGTPEANRFDVLASLIEAYETKHYPIGAE
ncbi:MAG: transcriptional regulator [Mesorhizobium sp.]|nr:MAG: transcriptional regulator [Mesorhizobium sp.]TIV21851.1 MAG: transcriptional regulator [Mesorhizobium sp.]TIV67031.1 MAG: transcriptional regulator [Mesorhizobium sp.]TIV99946.1 MAG: transcriptional regulator [Mesorhizobium sp.]